MNKTMPGPSVPREKTLFLLALLWMGLVFFHYHPLASFLDFSFLETLLSDFRAAGFAGLAANAGGFAGTLSCSAAVFLTLWAWGRKFNRRFGLEKGNAALRFCVETALGILFFNGLWLGLGLNGLWSSPLLWGLGLLFLGGALWDLGTHPPRVPGSLVPGNPGRGGRALALLGAATFLLCLAQALVPEVYYDALVYHFSTLRFWQFHHGITDFYTNLYSYYPFGAELYLMNGLFFHGGTGAKVLDAFATLLCALAVSGWAKEEAGPWEACLAWAMVWAFPLAVDTAWDGRNDVLLAFFIVLFARQIWKWNGRESGTRPALSAGLWAGAALSVKYTAAGWVLIALAVWAWMRRRDRALLRKAARSAGWFAGSAAFLAAPWLLRNFSYTGNPLYPYFSPWLGGRTLSPGGFQALMWDHEASFGAGFGIWDWARRVLTVDLDNTIAPFFFSFLPLLLLPARRKPVTRYLGALGLWGLAAGFLVSHILRLQIPAIVLCLAAMALAAGEWKAPAWKRAWAVLTALLGVWSLLSLFRLGVNYYQSDKVWLGLWTPEAYLERNPQTASYYGLTRAAGALLAPGERVLVAGDARGFYYPRPFYTNSAFDEPVLARLARTEKDGRGIARRLREMGADALAVSGREGARLEARYHFYGLPPGAWKRLEDFIQDYTDPLYLKDGNGLYRLRPAPAPARPPVPDLLLMFKDGKEGPVTQH